ncbi:HAD family hydrolase [bacterium]|nr:HAD family hydrolase [bacterium]
MPKKGDRPNGAVFLDRDGTVIVDAHFLGDPERIEFLPGAVEAIKRLNEIGIEVVILTNQSGVAKGYLSIEQVEAVNARLLKLLEERGAKVAGIYYCPHHPEGSVPKYRLDCWNRKPNPGMALQAAKEHGIDLRKSFVVGDKLSDMQLAHNIHAAGILVRTGEGAETESQLAGGEAVFDTLSNAVGYIHEKIEKGRGHARSGVLEE